MRAMAAGICLARELRMDFRIVWCPNAELHARFDEIFEVPEFLKGKFIHPSPLTYSLLFSVPRKKNLYVSSITLRRIRNVFSPEDLNGISQSRMTPLERCSHTLPPARQMKGTRIIIFREALTTILIQKNSTEAFSAPLSQYGSGQPPFWLTGAAA